MHICPVGRPGELACTSALAPQGADQSALFHGPSALTSPAVSLQAAAAQETQRLQSRLQVKIDYLKIYLKTDYLQSWANCWAQCLQL